LCEGDSDRAPPSATFGARLSGKTVPPDWTAIRGSAFEIGEALPVLDSGHPNIESLALGRHAKKEPDGPLAKG
jgi:hypothetical protein